MTTITPVSLSKVPAEIAAAVQRGIDWLDSLDSWPHRNDEYEVTDWRNRINLDDFDIRDGYRCIGGQVFGDYEWMNMHYGLAFEDRVWLGLTGYTRPDEADVLQQAWIEALS